MCPICGRCGSNHWRVVEAHIKKCAVAQPNVVDRDADPGKPHWKKSDQPLKNHTRAEETEATYTLSVWSNPPNDEDAIDLGQIFECIREEWKVQVEDMREEAAAVVDKDDSGEDNNKQTRSKPKQSSHKTKGRQKGSSSKKVNLPDDNLDEFFGLSQDKNSQEMPDVTPTDLPTKPEGTESKDEPNSSSHGNIHRLP